MQPYYSFFVVPVPKARLGEYQRLSALSAQVWRDCGALSYVECLGDDVKPGTHTSFPQAVKLEDGETVAVGFATYRSREHGEEVMAKVMADPRMAGMTPQAMPFDGKRMFWGGFKPIAAA